MSASGGLLLSITIKAFDQASGIFAKVAGEAKQSQDIITRNAAAMQTAGVAMTAAGGAIAVAAGSGLSASMEMEGYNAKLLVAMKDSTKAAEMMNWAKKKAAQTPFEMRDVVDATVRLEMYGLSATEWFDKVGNMAGAMGKDVNQAVEAVADAVSGGGLERLKEFGITGNQLKEFGWSGDYSAKGIESLKTALNGLMEKNYGGGMEAMMNTAKGAMSNFQDAIFQIRVAVGDALLPALKAITPVLTTIATAIGKMAETPLGQFFIYATAAIGGLMLTIGPLLVALPSLVTGMSLLSGVLGVSGVAGAAGVAAAGTAGLGASITAIISAGGPIALAIIAIGALVYALVKLKQAYADAMDDKKNFEAEQSLEDKLATEQGWTDLRNQRKAELDAATPTGIERVRGALYGGGITSKDLAKQRVYNSQAQIPGIRRRASGGPVTPGMGYLVGENEAEMFFPDLPGEIRNQAQTKSLMATYEKFNDMADKATKGRWQDDMFAGFNAKTSPSRNTAKGTRAVNSASQIANILSGAFSGGNAGGSGGGNVSWKVSGIADLISALQGIGGGSGGSGGGGYDCRILIDLAPGLKATQDEASRRMGIEINNAQAARNVSPAY